MYKNFRKRSKARELPKFISGAIANNENLLSGVVNENTHVPHGENIHDILKSLSKFFEIAIVPFLMVSLSIIDYGAGNLRSIGKALEKVGAEIIITSNPTEILNKDGIVLPGVGAFGDAMEMLRKRNLITIFSEIVAKNKPLLGVCLGLQVLFSEGEEMGHFEGLNLIQGRVVKFPSGEKVPQIGWKTIEIQENDHYLVQGVPNQSYMYFVHSFHPVLENPDNAVALTTYGKTTYASMVCNKEIVATQFHPEKSSKWGLKILENFVDHCHR